MKIFISHAEKDTEIVCSMVELLYSMGLGTEDIFCSSVPELGIPIKKNIYEYIRKMIDKENIYTFFVLSENYYKSAVCLSEMGAVWVKRKEYITFLVPGFDYSDIKGVIDRRNIAIKMGADKARLKADLNNLKDDLEKKIRKHINVECWEFCRDYFIDKIQGKNPPLD